MSASFFYSPDFDLQLLGFQKLHKFDGHKFSKAWNHFHKQHPEVEYIQPSSPASDLNLRSAHSEQYLESIRRSKAIAQVIEVPLARLLPAKLLNDRIVSPVRLATQATFEAAQLVVNGNSKMAMNFGGGFHHAFEHKGGGFCFFADAAYAIKRLRESGHLAMDDLVLMIDLDAHHGNGFFSYFSHDSSVKMFDVYNFQVYPGFHEEEGATDFMYPIKSGCSGEDYLNRVRRDLPVFLKKFKDPKLVFYNAGNDVVEGDPLGLLNVSASIVEARDLFVIQALKDQNSPTVVMTSGGYTKDSWKLVSCLASSVFSG